MAGLSACAETDIKKIVALRTLSQLGVMVVGLGLSLKALRFFHLMSHALFKALLFLCVGVGIHTVYGTQDFRRFSTLARVVPGPRTLINVANIALLGFPFLTGFYRKDAILEGFYRAAQSLIGLGSFLLGIGLTAAYSLKLMRYAVIGSRAPAPVTLNGGASPVWVKGPLIVLGAAAILGGFLLAPFLSLDRSCLGPRDKRFPLCAIALGGCIG